MEYPSSILVRFRVQSEREIVSVSDSSSEFPSSEVSQMVFVASKSPAYFGSAQNAQLIHVFFASTELLALAIVDSS